MPTDKMIDGLMNYGVSGIVLIFVGAVTLMSLRWIAARVTTAAQWTADTVVKPVVNEHIALLKSMREFADGSKESIATIEQHVGIIRKNGEEVKSMLHDSKEKPK